MNVKVLDIQFSIKEEISKDETHKENRFPGSLGDKLFSNVKNYYLVSHIEFEYDDSVDGRCISSCSTSFGPIASISYDDQGLVKSTSIKGLPTVEEIKSAAQAKAQLTAESINKEKVVYAHVNGLLNQINTAEGIPHSIATKTGYGQLSDGVLI